MNYTQRLGSSQSFKGAAPFSRPVPHGVRRYSCPCVNSAVAAPLPTVKEEEVSNFSYDKVKAFTSGECVSPLAFVWEN